MQKQLLQTEYIFKKKSPSVTYFFITRLNKQKMISVAIVDDQRDIREGLQHLLNKAEGLECQSTYGDAESAIAGITAGRPDVVLMDIDLPNMSGIECVKVLQRRAPDVQIIMLTGYLEDAFIFKALQAGAFGYLAKTVFPSHLIHAIREVRSGGAPMSRHVARTVVRSFTTSAAEQEQLSRREQEVFDLLCEGASYKEIAGKLFVSTNTVRFHLKNIYKKLNVSSRHEAVRKSMRRGRA
jgi:DNA-binding NarL/FixJ family response regulator